jgi:hypothetical protein
MSDNSTVDTSKEKQLIKAIQSLPDAEMPTRDLWTGIADQLKPRETNTYRPNWIRWAIAATLVLSMSSVLLNWNFFQENTQQLTIKNSIDSNKKGVQARLKDMEQVFGLAKSALLSQIAMNTAQINTDFMSDVNRNLIIIERATSQLKAAIIRQPENSSLQYLLQATYQQELLFLTQLAKLNIDA